MNRDTKVIIFYSLFFVLTLLLGISSVILFLPIISFFLLKHGILKPVSNQLLPLLIPIVSACLIGLVKNPFYDVFKDVLYLLIPIIGILIGYYHEQKYGYTDIVGKIVTVGKILIIIFVVFQLAQHGLSIILNAREIREGRGMNIHIGMLPTLIESILLSRICYLPLKSRKDMIWLILTFLSILMTGGRSELFSFLIMVTVLLLPLIRERKKQFAKYISVIACIAVLFIVYTPQPTIDAIERSFNEVSISNKARLNKVENYRGYEAKKTLETISRFDTFHKIAGGGLGTKAHIGVDAPIMKDVPFTHNGYVYILLKSGIIGMFLYLLWGITSLNIFLKWKTYSPDEQSLKYIAIGSLAVLYFTHFVALGLFNSSAMIFYIPIGMAYSRIYSTNTSKIYI